MTRPQSSAALSALALAALLAGCAVPPATTATLPAQELPSSTVSAPAPAPDWWQRFGDARIDALVTEALANNRDLARAMARIDEARALLRGAQAERAPSVNANLSAARARASENGTIPGGGTGNLFDATLSVRYELDLWGRVASGSAAAREDLLATEYAREVLRTALAAQVVQAYAALQARECARRVTMIDPNIRLGFIAGKEAAYRTRIEGMIAKADIVKLSDEDLAWVMGEGDIVALARQILGRGPKVADRGERHPPLRAESTQVQPERNRDGGRGEEVEGGEEVHQRIRDRWAR